MRALGIVMALALAGAAMLLLGVKRFDEIAAARPNLAVTAGGETFFIPSEFVRGGGWRTAFLRAGGCWDVRDAAMLAGMASLAGCEGGHRVTLTLPTSLFGPEVAAGFHKPKLVANFWPAYVPAVEELNALSEAWAGRGAWAQRSSSFRADWKLWRLETPASPWVYLLAFEPRRGDARELSADYAGRCYRPERSGDAGMTCEFALRVGASAVLEFSLGPDEMMMFAPLRAALEARVNEWRAPQNVPVSGSFAPSA